MDEFKLDELDINPNAYSGFILKAELHDNLHCPGPDVVLNISLKQSLRDVFTTMLNCAYMMKEACNIIYINILSQHIEIHVDKYGVPCKDDMLRLYEPFNKLFMLKAGGAFADDLSEMYEDINSGKFLYEE